MSSDAPAAKTPASENPSAKQTSTQASAAKNAPAKEPAAEASVGKSAPAKAPSAQAPAKKPAPAKEPAAKTPATKPPAKKTPQGRAPLHKTSVSDEVVIRFDEVTKTYNLYKNDRGRFLGLFNYNRKGSFLGSVDACKDLSFEVKKGEAVAFLGHNGAGKSTTLKMVTGVTHPTSGEVEVTGRVSALLELTAGFDMQLTGRENIALRGQILGLTKEQIAEVEPAIIDFAELGLYIDQPMRTYSSGMKARLGFAFAVAIEPEILVVDEALSVGDRAFQRKCIERIREIMMDENVTVLFVTHASAMAKEFCSRGIVLDHGQKMFDGDIEAATEYYEKNY